MADEVALNVALEHLAHAEPSEPDYATLKRWLLRDRSSAAFGITPDTVDAQMKERSRWFQLLMPGLTAVVCDRLGWQTLPLIPLWQVWLPLAQQISAHQRQLGHPLVQGMLGLQGSGKTTLAVLLTNVLMQMGHRVAQLSLDDLYLPYADRQTLQQADPRFRWRGPPGTHDVALGREVLRQVRAGTTDSIALPRFDKSLHNGAGDRTTPERVANIDVLLFEGWFVGVRPVAAVTFDNAPPPITTEGDRQFARDINQRLYQYLPLWDQLDSLMVLYPGDYRLSLDWRKQAEHQMAATGRNAMTDDEIDHFVDYFWRSLHPALFVEPLLHDPTHVDWIIHLRGDRSCDRVERLQRAK